MARKIKPFRLDACPICGKVVSCSMQHRCSQASLNAIDGRGKCEHHNSENKKPYWIRLQHGFEALRLSDDSFDAKSDEE